MRLIDADKLLQQIKFDYDLDYGETLIDPRDFADAVCDSPTVDAVPVVRCRDCKFWEPYGSKASRKIGDPLERYGGCEIWHGGHLESGFCSDGKRRDQSADVRNMGQFAGGGKMDGGSDERP